MSDEALQAALIRAKYWQDEYDKLAARISILKDGTLIHVATAMAMDDGTPYVAIKDGLNWANLVGKALYASAPTTAKVIVKMPITAAMVRDLVNRTDASQTDCKRALEDANGDMDKAESTIMEH